MNQFRLMTGFDLVLVGRQGMIQADLQSVNKAFLDLCARAKILAK
jgi:ribonuclease P protein component